MSDVIVPSRSRNAGLGSDTLYYFRSVSIDPVLGRQRILVPMVKEQAPPDGYVRCEANSMKELERVSREYEAQKRSDFARVDAVYLAKVTAKIAMVRKRLNQRLMESGVSEFERDFIRVALVKLAEGEKNIQPRRIEGCFAIESTDAPVN